jgi:hypothetical protein
MKHKQQPQIDFDKFRIDLSEEIKEPIPLISMGDKPLFRRGGISCIFRSCEKPENILGRTICIPIPRIER